MAPYIEEQVRSVLEPGVWAIQHAKDNNTALAMAHVKSFDLIREPSQKTSAQEDVNFSEAAYVLIPGLSS